MQKRSFFQKLTGSYPYDEDEESSERNDPQPRKISTHIESPTPLKAEEETDGQLTVDVYQTADAIVLQSMVAGVRPEDLDISITREMVTIKGRREDQRNVNEQDFYFRELYWGHFSRTVVLPVEIEPEEAEATERHGLLTIKLPKINKDRVQKLRVKTGQ